MVYNIMFVLIFARINEAHKSEIKFKLIHTSTGWSLLQIILIKGQFHFFFSDFPRMLKVVMKTGLKKI